MKRKAAALKSVLTVGVMAAVASPAMAISLDIGGEPRVNITGYLREHISMNLENHPDLEDPGRGDFSAVGGAGELSMVRSTVLLQGDADLGWGSFTAIWRGSREYMTNYEKGLDNALFQTGSLKDQYNENEFREWYLDFSTGRVDWRLGKQQVVWGETDSFTALDVIHGYDYSWRAQFEAENEELRKPLIMANAVINFPEIESELQLLYRPGWDNDDDMGLTLDLWGGRWAANGTKGINLIGFPLGVPGGYNYDHNSGDTDSPSYGTRWSGMLPGSISYTLNYYHTLNAEPIFNTAWAPYGGEGPGLAGLSLILPEIDIFGGSMNVYSRALDVVFRGELAYTPNKPFNTIGLGLNAFGVPTGGPSVIEKDTARMMFGIDKTNLPTMKLLGTSQPSFLTFQLFDTWLPDFKHSDRIADVQAKMHEHNVTASIALGLNYRYDTIQPGLAAIYDATNGGGAFLPSVNFIWGDHWRLKVGATIFYKNAQQCGSNADCTHQLGTFDNNDQLDARLTYQF
ncbi:MAG: hypothetical protein J4A00_04430 [Gammaproteobacteria bacterium]|nr:hypothetical protein [Gammaproteobacteria bacterium]